MRTLNRLLVAAAFSLALGPSLRAEVDKEKRDAEEKKARPELEHDRGGRDRDSHKAFHEKLLSEGEENLEEIRRLLDDIQNNLAQKNTGSSTQSQQKKAVQRMKDLIKKLSDGCKMCQASGGGGKGSKKGAGGQGQNESEKKEAARQAQARKNQTQVGSEQSKPREQGKKEDNRDRLPNNRFDKDRLPDSGKAKLIERLRKSGRWGFLPPKVREEMVSAAGKEAPAEYRDIIERYYQRISDTYNPRRKRR
ncbi:MAG: hypothetical protein O7J95_19825 [Planctomycetota bacterium]|nr:hypothetical protein [Planctomycetota bacterium]